MFAYDKTAIKIYEILYIYKNIKFIILRSTFDSVRNPFVLYQVYDSRLAFSYHIGK